MVEYNIEGIGFGDNGEYVWLTNGLCNYSLHCYDQNNVEKLICIIKEFDNKFYLEKALIGNSIVTYGSNGKVIGSADNKKFVFKNNIENDFIDILTNPDEVVKDDDKIGILNFDEFGRPSLSDGSNINEMKGISDSVISHFINTSNGYEFGLSRQVDYFSSALTSLSLGQKNLLVKNINDNMKAIRYELGNRVRHQLRIIPELKFFIDDSLDYAEKIDKLLGE